MSARELRTPDQVSAENRLICEKLLGWELVLMPEDNYPAFKRSFHEDPVYAPCFTRWAEAGLILDALQRLSYDRRTAADVLLGLGDQLIGALLTPAAIRAAALEFIKAAKL